MKHDMDSPNDLPHSLQLFETKKMFENHPRLERILKNLPQALTVPFVVARNGNITLARGQCLTATIADLAGIGQKEQEDDDEEWLELLYSPKI